MMSQHPDVGKRAILMTDPKIFGIITSVKEDNEASCWDHIAVNNQAGGPHRHYWAIEGDPGPKGVQGEFFEKHKNVFA